MVAKGFKLQKNNGAYEIVEISQGQVLELPECIIDQLKGTYKGGKYPATNVDRFIGCTLVIALSGTTDSLRIVNPGYYNANSVLKKIVLTQELQDNCSIPDVIEVDSTDGYGVIKEFEKYHIIELKRDKAGNNNTIHAYLMTKEGELRCQFPNQDKGDVFAEDSRLYLKANNVKFWAEGYTIAEGSSGGKFVRLSEYEEIK